MVLKTTRIELSYWLVGQTMIEGKNFSKMILLHQQMYLVFRIICDFVSGSCVASQFHRIKWQLSLLVKSQFSDDCPHTNYDYNRLSSFCATS